MDYSELDKVRRSTTPLQLDAVESFARGRLSRREFITARHDRRPVDGIDQRRDRGLRRHHDEPAAQRRRRRAPHAGASCARAARPRPAARSGSPASGRPARSTRSR